MRSSGPLKAHLLHEFPHTCDLAVINVYPLSGYYAGLQRALYWFIIAFTLLGSKKAWLVAAAFNSAMIYSSVAALHGMCLFILSDSNQYYDSDAMAISEISSGTSILLLAWLARSGVPRSKNLRSILSLWGYLIMVGAYTSTSLVFLQNSFVSIKQNACVTKLPSNATTFSVEDWETQSNCSWRPYENVTHPMRGTNEVVIVRDFHQLAKWMGKIVYAGVSAMYGFGIYIRPMTSTLRGFEFFLPFSKLRHAIKWLFFRDKIAGWTFTFFLCISWCVSIAILIVCEMALHYVPASEGPRSVGQWGPCVAFIFVLAGVFVNHRPDAAMADMIRVLVRDPGLIVRLLWVRKGIAPDTARITYLERARIEVVRDGTECTPEPTTGTQMVDVEAGQSSSSRVHTRARRFSESDIGLQHLRLDADLD